MLSAGVVAAFQFAWDDRWGLPYVVDKGPGSLIDLWSLVHVAVGVLVAKRYFIRAKKYFGKRWMLNIVYLGLNIAFGFEGFEFSLEAGLAGEDVSQWLGGHEHWTNRLLLDPLAPLLGIVIYRYFPRSWYVTLLFCIVWWTVLLCFMPNCMGIDDYLIDLFTGG